MVRSRYNKNKEPGILFRGLRSFVTVVVLTAFILGISYFVKEVSTLDVDKVMKLAGPYLDKAGLDSEQVGEVAGDFVERMNEQRPKGDGSAGTVPAKESSPETKETGSDKKSEGKNAVIISLMADSHDNNVLLAKAVQKAKELESSYIFHLGDFTDLGLVETLKEAKEVLDASGIKYYAVPGDHDLWKSVGPEYFLEVFDKDYYSVSVNGIKFVLLDNSANYSTIPTEQMAWFKNELPNTDIVILSQPIYHPTNNRVMGVVNGEEVKKVRDQANELLDLIRTSPVKAIIAADHHQSSKNTDPVKSELTHYVIGAVTNDRNLQTPRFSALYLFENGSFELKEVVLE